MPQSLHLAQINLSSILQTPALTAYLNYTVSRHFSSRVGSLFTPHKTRSEG